MGARVIGDPKIRKQIRDKQHKQFREELYGESLRDDDGNRLCEKCEGILSDEPWEARVCESCQDAAQQKAVDRFHDKHPGYRSAAVMKSRKKKKEKKVAWLLARWPNKLTHEDCLDIMCNRCLVSTREMIDLAQRG